MFFKRNHCCGCNVKPQSNIKNKELFNWVLRIIFILIIASVWALKSLSSVVSYVTSNVESSKGSTILNSLSTIRRLFMDDLTNELNQQDDLKIKQKERKKCMS